MAPNVTNPASGADAPRAKQFFLARHETRVLGVDRPAAARLVMPDHLTALGVVAAFGIAGAYLSNGDKAWLWAASALLLVHWLGDSLDGTLAWVRKIERPKYGYYLDHLVDALATAVIGLGLGLSPYMLLSVGLAIVICYLILSINTYLETQAFGVFALGWRAGADRGTAGLDRAQHPDRTRRRPGLPGRKPRPDHARPDRPGHRGCDDRGARGRAAKNPQAAGRAGAESGPLSRLDRSVRERSATGWRKSGSGRNRPLPVSRSQICSSWARCSSITSSINSKSAARTAARVRSWISMVQSGTSACMAMSRAIFELAQQGAHQPDDRRVARRGPSPGGT